MTPGTFLDELVRQVRAGDMYGRLDGVSDEALLRPYILDTAQRDAIPILCEVDGATEARMRAFFQAVATRIETETGATVSYALDISHEGFGRLVLFAGQLVLVSKVLRDAQRFGFASLEKLAAEGERLVSQGSEAARCFPAPPGMGDAAAPGDAMRDVPVPSSSGDTASQEANVLDVNGLRTRMRRLKSEAGQLQMDLHDLAESLPQDWQKIPEVADRTHRKFAELARIQHDLQAAEPGRSDT